MCDLSSGVAKNSYKYLNSIKYNNKKIHTQCDVQSPMTRAGPKERAGFMLEPVNGICQHNYNIIAKFNMFTKKRWHI